jgi:hypothetical protein
VARLLRPGLSVTVTVDTGSPAQAAADGIVGTAQAQPKAAPAIAR